MKKNKVKDIIRESIYNLLNEYSSEQRLPFDDDKFKNKNYLEQYADWLEDFGNYGKLPPSKMNFWDELRKAIQIIIDDDLKNRKGHSLDYNNNVEKSFNALYKKINPYLQFNSDGNIYVERAVQIRGSASSYNASDENGKDPMQLYNSLVKNYNHNVGGCWAFREGKAAAYCGEGDGDTILFRGYIRVEDIDVIKTALLNYNVNEFEIRVKPNAKVELFDVLFNNKYKLPLRGTLIVSASYFGNNGKYNDFYAAIDDGFGHTKQFMDRKGGIYDNFNDMLQTLLKQGYSIKDICDYSEPLTYNLFSYYFNNRFFIGDQNGHLLKNCPYLLDYIDDFVDGITRIQRNDGKWSLINEDGDIICDWYNYIDKEIYENSFRVQRDDGKWSLMNNGGNIICDWFDFIDEFIYEESTRVQRSDGKWSLINEDGDIICDWYNYIDSFENQIARVKLQDNKWNWIRINGQLVYTDGIGFKVVNNFIDGCAIFKRDDGLYNVMQKNGKIMFKDLWFHDVKYIYDSLFIGQGPHYYSYIFRTDGTILNQGKPFFTAKLMGSRGIKVQRLEDGRFNIIKRNDKGEFISNQWFDDIYARVKDGYAAVLDDKKYIIKHNGQIISEQKDDKLLQIIIEHTINSMLKNKKER